MLTLNLHQAKQLVSLFGDCDDTLVTVQKCSEGHSGMGVYAHYDEYPEEGSWYLNEQGPSPLLTKESCCDIPVDDRPVIEKAL